MAVPLLATKLHLPPQRGELVPRPQLSARLSAGLPGKLTLVAAPAGFGKTTVVASWVRSLPHPVAWVSLDPSDDDLDFFPSSAPPICALSPQKPQLL